MANPNQPPQLMRDQQRAQHAYARIGAVPDNQRKDYKILVNDLGANILRSGLAVAIATVEREAARDGAKADAAQQFLDDLGQAEVTCLANTNHTSLGERVRSRPLDQYLLASREMLKVVVWFKRAVQALFGGVE